MSIGNGTGPYSACARGVKLIELTIAVVDASPSPAAIVRSLLLQNGCRSVVQARTGAEFLAQVECGTIDVAIIDMRLRGMSGIECVRILRRLPAPVRQIPVILLSSDIQCEAIESARAAGVNEYMLKPFSAATLLASIVAVTTGCSSFVITSGHPALDRRPPRPEAGGTAVTQPAIRQAGNEFGSVGQVGDMHLEFVPIPLTDRLMEFTELCRTLPSRQASWKNIQEQMLSIARQIEVEAQEQPRPHAKRVAQCLTRLCGDSFLPECGAYLVLVERHIQTLYALLKNDDKGCDPVAADVLVQSLAGRTLRYLASQEGSKHRIPASQM